ncbi:MAG TPA: hypothetical protein VFC25_01845 [Verrucomicrobiae bacterium]|nr:hypothetical protein [Verrucomicrobiae bacterium]
MGKQVRKGGRRGVLAPLLALLALGPAGFVGCNDNSGGDTVVVNGLDCGLVRDQMVGTWTVSYQQAVRSTLRCDNATLDNTPVSVASGTTSYTSLNVYAPIGTVGFTMEGSGPLQLPKEIIATIDADSCLALVKTWENDEAGYLECIGTADLTNRLLNVVCDSFDLDTNADGDGDTACTLNASVTGTVGLP